MYLILMVLHDPEDLDPLLGAWDEAGVNGVTILPSTGLARFRSRFGLRDDMPLIPKLSDFFEHEENINRTLFTIVDGDAMVDKVLAATELVLGDLNLPNTGILSVISLERVIGLNRPRWNDARLDD